MQRHLEHAPETVDPAPPDAAPVAPVPAVAAVLALQRSAGNRATAAVLARQPKPAHVEKFVLGTNISLPLAKRAQELAAKPLGEAQLRELHDLALKTEESVDDDERLFITALLEAGNPERLIAAKLRTGEKLELTLALDKTTKANLQKVIDIGRPDIDPAVASAVKDAADAKGDKALADKATKRAEEEASKQILKLAGSGGKKRANAVIAYAKANGVAVPDVLAAMINAASDSTAGDQVAAGIVYATAAAAGHGAAPHIRAGRIKVDERPITGVNAGASGLYNPTAEGGKADTVYVPGTIQITDLRDRATIIHELTHALQDERAPAGPPQLADRGNAEIEAYMAEATYMLKQVDALSGEARKAAAAQGAKGWGVNVVSAAILVSQGDASGKLAKVLKEINGLAAQDAKVSDKALDTLLKAGADDLRALIRSRQKTSNVTFDKLSGESRISSVLPRKRIKNATADTIRLTIGVELTQAIAQKAWDLTLRGAVDDKGLAELRAVALSVNETIDDNERLLMAALLDPENVKKFHGLYPTGFKDEGLAIDFESATITPANRNRVKDFGRNERPTGPPISDEQEKRERGTDAGIDREMQRMAGALSLIVTQSLALADEAHISHLSVYFAMLNAASDSTAPDRAVAAAAYVVARREGLAEAADLMAGRIKVDAVPSTYLPHNWHAMYAPEGGTTKGDTVYLPFLLDVSTLEGQASIIHELQHAADDKAAKPNTRYYKARGELAAYRREARFLLESIAKLEGDKRKQAIDSVGASVSGHLMICLVLESNARPDINEAYAYNDLVRAINAVEHPMTGADLEKALDHATKEENEAAALKAIAAVYGYPVDAVGIRGGLHGESALD